MPVLRRAEQDVEEAHDGLVAVGLPFDALLVDGQQLERVPAAVELPCDAQPAQPVDDEHAAVQL